VTEFPTNVITQFQERRGVQGEVLIWIGARDRATGNREWLGFWTGDDHRQFTINGEARTYFGAGNVVGVPPVRSKTGLDVIYHTITLPRFSDELRIALEQYDPRLAPVQVHSVAIDIDTGAPLSDPIRRIKGTLQEAPSTFGAKGSSGSKFALKIASSARLLHQGLPIYKSDEAQQSAYPGDLGREFVGIAGEWPVEWGED
jgi:hypothetical protein